MATGANLGAGLPRLLNGAHATAGALVRIKHTKNYGKSPFYMGNSLFLWPFSIAMLVCQRVNEVKSYAIFGGLNPTGQSLLVTF